MARNQGSISLSQEHHHHHVSPQTEDKRPPKERREALEHAIEVLKESDLKQTQPRLKVLQILTERHGPFSTEELFRLLKNKNMDLVTIYRCLSAFEKLGLVRRCDFGDGVARYEFESKKSHHHHVVCRCCYKTENITDCVATRLQKTVEKMGYKQVSHNMEFFGICRTCQPG